MGIRCKSEIHYIEGVVFLVDNDRVRLMRSCNEVGVGNMEFSAIGQV